MKMILFKRLLGCMVLCFSFIEAYTQSAELNYVDTRNFPDIKAAFTLKDNAGIDIRNFSVNDILINEGGKIRTPLAGWPFCSEISMNKISAILVYDCSASMYSSMDGTNDNPPTGEAKWELTFRAMEHFINALNPDSAECAIIEFGTIARLRQSFTNDKAKLLKIVTQRPNSLQYTNYNTAFLRNRENVNNVIVDDSTNSALYVALFAKYKPVIIFLTDGKHNPSNRNGDNVPFMVTDAYNLAKERNAYIFIVKIGSEPIDGTSLNNLTQMAEVEGNLIDNFAMDVTDPAALNGFFDKVGQISSQLEYLAPCEVVWKSECNGGGNLQLNFPNHYNMSIYTTFTIPDYVKPVLEINPYKITFHYNDLSVFDTTVIKLTARNKSIEFPNPGYYSTDQRFSIINWGAKGNPPFILEKDSSVYLTIRFAPTDLSTLFAEILIDGTQCSGELIVLDANVPNDVSEPSNGIIKSKIESIFPNPASGKTEVKYYSDESGITKIWVSNILGNKLFELENRIMDSGENSVSFNAGGLPDGIYFVVMQTPTQILKSKFAIIK